MIESRSPQNPGEVVFSAEELDGTAVASVAERVESTGRYWAGWPPGERARALEQAADALTTAADSTAELVTTEAGKPISEARAEVARGISILRYYAQQAWEPQGEVLPTAEPALLYTRRRPRGVAGLITPWNFPVAIPLWKAAPSLAFGNGVLWKPSPEATGVAVKLASVLADALPHGLVEVVPGGADTGQAVIQGAEVVSFTGSVPVGSHIAQQAARKGISFQAEMGGQNASIVLPGADVQAAARLIALASMGFPGQKCTATSRVIVVGPQNDFLDALVPAVADLMVGDPAEPGYDCRPADLAGCSESGAGRCGGCRGLGRTPLDRWERGRSRWIVCRPTPGRPATGRRASAHPRNIRSYLWGENSRHVQEAVRVNNAVEYGLVTAIFTRDVELALSAAQRVDTGLVRVNAETTGVDFHAPFGGEKASSAGPREQGKAAQEFYTSVQTVTLAAGA